MGALTEEQEAAVHAAVASTGPLKVPAGAGCGKTYTLRAMADTLHRAGLRVLYLAFNAAMKSEAEPKFKGLADVYTTHGFPFRVLGIGPIARKHRRLGRLYPADVVRALSLEGTIGGLSADRFAGVVCQVLSAYLYSAAPVPTASHLPPPYQKNPESDTSLALLQATADLFDAADPDAPTDLPLPHDLYLKYWQVIGAPGLEEYDVILLDESQDSSPVILEALAGLRVIYVGDTHQQIYSFRAAVDAMTAIDAPETPLTQSFRFGPRIAHLANAILAKKQRSPLKYPLAGTPRLATEITRERLQPPYTRIYRTNYQLIRDSVVLADRSYKVQIVGDMSDFAKRIKSAVALANGRRRQVRDPLIRAFDSYEDLLQAADSESDTARDLRQIVRVLDDYEDRIDDVLDLLEIDHKGGEDVTLTTAHKAKGREWGQVAIMSDFDQTLSYENEFSLPVQRKEEELNLLYVAATRATNRLTIQAEFLGDIAEQAGVVAS